MVLLCFNAMVAQKLWCSCSFCIFCVTRMLNLFPYPAFLGNQNIDKNIACVHRYIKNLPRIYILLVRGLENGKQLYNTVSEHMKEKLGRAACGFLAFIFFSIFITTLVILSRCASAICIFLSRSLGKSIILTIFRLLPSSLETGCWCFLYMI